MKIKIAQGTKEIRNEANIKFQPEKSSGQVGNRLLKSSRKHKVPSSNDVRIGQYRKKVNFKKVAVNRQTRSININLR